MFKEGICMYCNLVVFMRIIIFFYQFVIIENIVV